MVVGPAAAKRLELHFSVRTMRQQNPAPGGKFGEDPGQVLEPDDQRDLIEHRPVVAKLRVKASQGIQLTFDLKAAKTVAHRGHIDPGTPQADRHLFCHH